MRKFISALSLCTSLSVSIVATAQAQMPGMPERPKLVVFVAVDQMRQDYLERWANQFTGGLKRLREQGAYFTNAFQDHASTETAVGHSTMLSGRFPRSTGIITNEYGVPDPQARTLNGIGAGASPFRFRGTVLMDWMRVLDPLSRGLSVSFKDRGAILPMGRAKQNVFWYSNNGTFTTSSYYADTLPAWLRAFNARKLPEQYATRTWDLLLPASSYAEPDSMPIEAGGKDFTFPHVPPASLKSALAGLASFPWMDKILAELALTGVDSLELGHAGHIDLLSISFSTMDAIGHKYGPDSREVHDQVVRLDRTLGALMDSLDARFKPGEYVLVLTADHGVTPFPELHAANLKAASDPHVESRSLLSSVRAIATAHNADSAGVDFSGGMLILNEDGLHHDRALMDSIARAFATQARKVPGVMRVDWVRDLARGDTVNDPITRRWNQQVPRDLDIPVVVTLEPGHVWGRSASASHGQPTDDDSHVPIIFFGPQFKAGRYAQFARTVDIAPTLAKLLDVHPGQPLDGKPLDQIFK